MVSKDDKGWYKDYSKDVVAVTFYRVWALVTGGKDIISCSLSK